MALAAFKNGWSAAGAPEGPTNGIPAASLSRGVWVFTRNPWSSPLSPHGLLQLQAPCRPQFLLLSSGKGLTSSGDLGSAWTPRAQILWASGPRTINQLHPCLPNSLPRGTHLLLEKLIHYSLKAPFLAGSKLPTLHFAATT